MNYNTKLRSVLFILIVMICGCSDTCTATDYDGKKMASHPRLLLKKGGEKNIRKTLRQTPVLWNVHDRIIARSDEFLAAEPVKRIKEGKRLLAVSREALTRIYYLSYAYRMTEDERYASRAEQEMLAVSDFTDWNPSHFLDTGEMTMAVAIGYDWLYDKLSPEARRVIREAIVEKGFNAADDKSDAWFYHSKTNWNSVCNGGLLYGALAIYEDEPQLCKTIIDKCLQTNPLALEGYGPDGGYPEGYGYWGYGTSFQVMLIAALESALGTDYGLSEAPGFLESARFMQYMTAPSGSCYNFSDARDMPQAMMMQYWFAKKLSDPSIIYLEQANIANPDVDFAEDRLLPSLLVFASQTDCINVTAPASPSWFNRGDTPVFIYRGGWNSPTDTYLGVKGGRPYTSHAHMDAGSYVYERDGERWSIDLGMQEYITLESKGVDLWNSEQDAQRWDVFRIGPMAHNTIIVNGRKHLVKGKAEIVDTVCSPLEKGAVIDMTPAIADGVSRATRRVSLDADDNLVVIDSLQAPAGKPAAIQWQMLTGADVDILDDRTMLLTSNGKQMHLSFDIPGEDAKLKVWTTESANDFDQSNPGTRRVGFTTVLPAGEEAVYTVKLHK